MLKLVTLLALLGVSQTQIAYPTGDWWSFDVPTKSGFYWPSDNTYSTILDKWGLNIKHFAQGDFGIGTFYKGNTVDAKADTRSQEYGVHFWSYMKHHAVVDYAPWYESTVETSFEPLYVAPYIQRVLWTRFEADKSFTLEGARVVRAFDQAVNTVENISITNMGTWQDSLTKLEMPQSSDFKYADNFEHEWEDGRYSVNLLEETFADFYQQLVDDKIIGEYNYYSQKFM